MNITIIGKDGFEHVFDCKPQYGMPAIMVLVDWYSITQTTLLDHIKKPDISVSILRLNSS